MAPRTSVVKPPAEPPAPAKPPARAKSPAPAAPPRAPMTIGERSVVRYVARQPERLRPILNELRALVREVASDATIDRRWGVLVCQIRGEKLCVIRPAIRKDAVFLVLDPSLDYPDPEELLQEGGGVGRCYLDMRPGAEVPRATIVGCLRVLIRRARRRVRARR